MTDFTFPVLLALDTSTDQATVGLTNGDLFAELRWPAGRSQTTSVLPAIDHLLTMNGLTMNAIAAIAVAIGPGTFTGLRVGLSIAKGLSLAKDIPLVSIKTLAITAYPYSGLGRPLLVTLPAGRGRVVWEIHDNGGVSEPHNTTVPELIEVLVGRPDLFVAGELLPEHRATIAESHSLIESVGVAGRRGSVLAQLGWERWRRGDVDDAATLEPIYVHGRPASTAPIEDRLRRKSTR
ncbi:MAG TPA: tRNA (adenosine(37)-N6)-threonylcarbamoyltransferase complex dimerization subunit type 1 TsaB [Thermomicrobiales bacterium]|nr:tRNA (adenosine(37)-N6)-threonylcarbamoyltransferase complex dimerization subunit type 1 TsaB [Thermomicrobiales bacterium]